MNNKLDKLFNEISELTIKELNLFVNRCLESIKRNSSLNNKLILATLNITILSIIVTTTFITITHNANFEFDESNTLAISKLTISTINEVLSKEQNFPLYYYILNSLYKISGDSENAAKILNLFTWYLSVCLIYKISKTYATNIVWQKYFVLIYVLSPMFFMYAYFIRMYGLINLISITFIYLSMLYIQTKKSLWLILQIPLILISSLLHPSAIYAIPAMFITSMLLAKSSVVKKLIFFTSLISIVIIAFQISNKTDIYRIYFGQGVEYLKNDATYFYQIPLMLFTTGRSALAPLFYFTIIYVIYKTTIQKKWDKIHAPILIPGILIGIIHLVNTQFASPRHFIFFSAPLLLIIVISLQKQALKTQILCTGLITVVSTIMYLSFTASFFHEQKTATQFCGVIKSINQGTLITDWGTYNSTKYCTKSSNVNILILTPEKVISSQNENAMSILNQQALLGGTYWFRNLNNRFLIKETSILSTYLSTNTPPQPLYFVTDYLEKRTLGATDLQPFAQKYTYIQFIEPSIFQFEQIP